METGTHPGTFNTEPQQRSSVDLVDEFIYLKSLISHNGGSEAEILRRIRIARECFSLLEKNIWRSHILTDTKVGHTSSQSCSMGARHGLAARPWQSASMPSTPGVCGKFLRIPYTRHTTNDSQEHHRLLANL